MLTLFKIVTYLITTEHLHLKPHLFEYSTFNYLLILLQPISYISSNR